MVLVLVAGTLGFGFTSGFGSEASAEPTVQAFLLDWQLGRYAAAAALTDGDAGQVAAQLAASFTDLDAANVFFNLGPSITQHGNAAVARFTATVDMAQAGQQWTYAGRFRLTSAGGRWVIDWTPSVINPSLAAGDRLAVVTSYPPRAAIEDTTGQPLLTDSTAYRIGVRPERLANAGTTAADFSRATGLNAQQVLGQIRAAPPRSFLSLLTLAPASFRAIWPRIAKVPGLGYQRVSERLFDSDADEAVGAVGTENSVKLRAEGAPYQPGMTVGLSGLERVYQDQLTGTPTTSVVVVNPAGRIVATFPVSSGHPGTPLRTTLSARDQDAAAAVLNAQPYSGEIVAVDWRSGAIRVLASHRAGTGQLPSGAMLDAKVTPGMAFSIVSAAALLSAGVTGNQPMPCKGLAARSAAGTFASDFAAGCGTAFAGMSRTLSPGKLAAAERAFGIGAPWHLVLPAFSGSATAPSGAADVAGQLTGQSGVLMSPLGMAMVAAEVASGVGRAPELISGDPSATWQPPLSKGRLGELRKLMRLAVQSRPGSAHAAELPGAAVYGQSGVVKTGAKAYLSWFVGYRGNLAVAVLATGRTPSRAAAALAGAFFRSVG